MESSIKPPQFSTMAETSNGGLPLPSTIHVTEDKPGITEFVFPNGCKIIVGVTTTELTMQIQDEVGKPLDRMKIIPLALLT